MEILGRAARTLVRFFRPDPRVAGDSSDSLRERTSPPFGRTRSGANGAEATKSNRARAADPNEEHAAMEYEAATSSPIPAWGALQSLRASIALKVVQAHALDAEAGRARVCGLDASDADLRLAEMIHAIRQEVAAMVAHLEKQSGERWTLGIKTSHFVREVRNAQQALAIADLQSSRLGFVVDHLAGEKSPVGISQVSQ